MTITLKGFNPNLGAEFMKRYNGRVISFGRRPANLRSSSINETSHAVPKDLVGATDTTIFLEKSTLVMDQLPEPDCSGSRGSIA